MHKEYVRKGRSVRLGLRDYKDKTKKTSDDNKKKANEKLGAMEGNCAGIKNAATTVGEIISMCVFLVRLRHCSSRKHVKTFALLRSLLHIKFTASATKSSHQACVPYILDFFIHIFSRINKSTIPGSLEYLTTISHMLSTVHSLPQAAVLFSRIANIKFDKHAKDSNY